MNSMYQIQDDEDTLRRRQYLCESFHKDWYSQNIPKLAAKFNVTKDEINADLESTEFQEIVTARRKTSQDFYSSLVGFEALRENYRANIRLAAVSSEDILQNLRCTVSAINEYKEAMKESVIFHFRRQLETILISKVGAVLPDPCDICGAPMRIVNPYGWNSYFAGCSTYPECYNQKQITVEDLEKVPRAIDFWEEGELEQAIQGLTTWEKDWMFVSYNEASTRAEFIDPILRALGWDTYTWTNVEREPGTGVGRADYALSDYQGGAWAVVEAKRLFEVLPRHEDQLRRHMEALMIDLGILTNGVSWRTYSFDADRIIPTLVIADLLADENETSLRSLCDAIGNQ